MAEKSILFRFLLKLLLIAGSSLNGRKINKEHRLAIIVWQAHYGKTKPLCNVTVHGMLFLAKKADIYGNSAG